MMPLDAFVIGLILIFQSNFCPRNQEVAFLTAIKDELDDILN